VTKAEAAVLPSDSLVHERRVIILKSFEGTCSQLQDATCKCHGVRPRGCREYPWYSVDGRLFYDSGCPGIRHDRDEHPNQSNLTDVGAYLPVQSRLFKSMLLWLLLRS
jgi:Fe-S-cluster containining protein